MGNSITKFHFRSFDHVFRDLYFMLFDRGVCLPFNKGNKLNLNNIKPQKKKKKTTNHQDLHKSLNYVHRLLKSRSSKINQIEAKPRASEIAYYFHINKFIHVCYLDSFSMSSQSLSLGFASIQ